MGKYFGTDGFRGEANITLTADHAFRLGRFLGWYCKEHDLSLAADERVAAHRPRIVVGKDTRRSSYMFEYAIVAGLTASGADPYMLHVTTTPSVSFVTEREDFDCGVMISASHNPYTDNGIKLVNRRGEKINDDTIAVIEAYLDGGAKALGLTESEMWNGDLPAATGAEVGRIIDYAAGRNRYVGYLISLAANSYKDFRVGLDCANGSAWMIGRAVFEALGAKTYVTGAEPDGLNINVDCGSTHIDRLKRLVVEKGLDVGFAFDGDADRCIAVDEKGNEIGGDHILYILGKAMKEQGALANNTVVTTIMSNMGLYRALNHAGIDYVQTTVGDRFIYENMIQNGHVIGGEQSGHVILRKYATTGDGILTAIMVMERIVDSKLPLSKLAEAVVMYPQVTKNIRVPDKNAVCQNAAVTKKLDELNSRLGTNGRMLLRKSGTEPVVRVMAEAETMELCERSADELISVIRAEGLSENI
ncbi:MAG: phosphoglucosamine mutase [Clostridia bacterium]|nr:phosphoglucosamine mutase [Clostridia bacterium]